MSKFIYGIDFGTTNSSLAILNTETNDVVKVFTTPSLLFFPKFQKSRANFEYAIGNEAVEKYVESRMEGRFLKSIKRVLPSKNFRKTRVANKNFKAEDLVAFIITHLKKQADDFLGEDIKTAVIGRPVVFDENAEKDALAQDRLSKAVKLSGFETFHFQLEPIGAAFTYERLLKKDELVLVGDFGGGTSDFTLMRLSPNAIHKANRQSDMISKGGIYLGGDNFDSSIMWHKGTPNFGRGVKEAIDDTLLDLPMSYFSNICSWAKMNFLNNLRMKDAISRSYVFTGYDFRVKHLMTLIDKNLGYLLFQEIEKAKIGLTKQDSATFEFDDYEIYFKEEISIKEFEETIIQKEVAKIEAYLEEYLQKNKVSPKDIDTVFMTGGTSMVRAMQKMMTKKFGKDKIKSGDNFNSVAMGLAYSYKVLNA